MEMRKEDMGRMFFKDSDNTDKDIVKRIVKEYFCSMPLNKIYLLNSRTLNYFTFIKIDSVNFDDAVNNFVDLIEDCSFTNLAGESCIVGNVKELEINKEMGYLEIWSDGEFFALMPWGVEII